MEILCPLTIKWTPFTEELRQSIDQLILKTNEGRRLTAEAV